MLACAIGSLLTIRVKTTMPHMDFGDFLTMKATKPHAFHHKTAFVAISKIVPWPICNVLIGKL
jgi:hypothetical protein